MWNEITTEKELNSFLDVMCYFHDSCLKEIKYISGAYVNEKLSMSAVNNQRRLSMIVQRQFKNPSVVEMQFVELKYLKLFPSDENYTCEILDATMILKEDCIYWCDCGGLSEKDINSYVGEVKLSDTRMSIRLTFDDANIGTLKISKWNKKNAAENKILYFLIIFEFLVLSSKFFGYFLQFL